MPTATDILVDKMLIEAQSAEDLARDFREDLELRTQYETEARTWRHAMRMVRRAHSD